MSLQIKILSSAVISFALLSTPQADAQWGRVGDVLKKAKEATESASDLIPTRGNTRSNTENATEDILSIALNSASKPAAGTDAQNRIYDNNSRYAVQAGGTGAAVGCGVAVGMQKIRGKEVTVESCIKGSTVGIYIGGLVVGPYVAAKQERAAAGEAAGEQEIAILNNELKLATETREAATEIVAYHRDRLPQLNEKLTNRQISRDAYQEKVNEMAYDLNQLRQASDGLQGDIAAVDEDIAEIGNTTKGGEFMAIRNSLEAEKNKLDQEIAALEAIISGADISAYG